MSVLTCVGGVPAEGLHPGEGRVLPVSPWPGDGVCHQRLLGVELGPGHPVHPAQKGSPYEQEKMEEHHKDRKKAKTTLRY